MGDSDNQKEEPVQVHLKQKSFFDTLTDIGIRLAFVFILLWSFDGFWQTDIEEVNNFQKSYFPEKYKQEQLKLSTFNENNRYLRDLESATKLRMEEANNNIEKSNEITERALIERDSLGKSLVSLANEMETLCRYFETSEMMIGHLTSKYSVREIESTLSCTNRECKEILSGKSKVRDLCQL